ncbi:hypothetical protein L9F63_020119 [Diploptera punctata]|uniref:Pentatricopeptide repeat-containing protein 2 n=1 Tax=Diploptera punctata TaxID=6984 RepID=A0AAD8EE04_DIPPU|nr:hypothetical protein L9F63_020119 [Diploptera punctata]
MMKKFNQQNKEIRFGSYIFGPVVMRMYYLLNKPEDALKAFKDPDMEGFFSQLGTYQILMDLLYENEMHQDVLDIFEIVKGRQHQDSKYPRNVVILTLAACYKLNTPESYKFAMDLWKELKEVGHFPMRRAVTFAAAIALNHNAPHVALEIVSSITQQNYVTVRNIKALALAEVGRPEDALLVLRSVLDIDIPTQNKQTFSSNVFINEVKAEIEKSGNKEMVVDFEHLEKRLAEGGHITRMGLNEQLCSQIAEVSRNQIEERNRGFLAASFNRQDTRNRSREYARPGLKDMY